MGKAHSRASEAHHLLENDEVVSYDPWAGGPREVIDVEVLYWTVEVEEAADGEAGESGDGEAEENDDGADSQDMTCCSEAGGEDVVVGRSPGPDIQEVDDGHRGDSADSDSDMGAADHESLNEAEGTGAVAMDAQDAAVPDERWEAGREAAARTW
jgi:hypothetical protein